MRPVLLELALGGAHATLRAYSTFYVLAFLLAPTFAAWFAGRRGLPWRRALAVYMGSLAAGVVGARVLDLFVAWRYYADDPARIFALSFSGFSVFGGLAAAAAAGVALARAVRLSPWRLADAAVLGLVLGQVLMRTGCFLNGCCFGIATSLPWGVRFQPGTPAWSHQLVTGAGGLFATLAGEMQPVHPAQVYEALGAVAFGAAALMLMRNRTPEGIPFLTYAVGFTLVRFGNHFLRARINTVTAPEWFYPVAYAGALAVLGALLTHRLMRARRRQGA